MDFSLEFFRYNSGEQRLLVLDDILPANVSNLISLYLNLRLLSRLWLVCVGGIIDYLQVRLALFGL